MKVDYDVIIIGAGPAGSSCAKHLTENGVKTLVVEKRKLPRYKCCTGLLSKRAQDYVQEHFGSIPENIYCDNKEFTFKFSKTGLSFVDDPSSIWVKTKRHLFDYFLLNNSNSKFLSSCVYKSHEERNDHIVIECINDNNKINLTCKYLIGADGGNSMVRKKIDSNFLTRKLIFALQILYKGSSTIDKNCLYYLTGKKYSQEFGWFNYENDHIVIGTSFFLDNVNNNYLNKINDLLINDFNLKIENEVRKEGCFVDIDKSNNKFCFGNNKNVLLIGEATGLLTIFAEGISSALFSGYHAANAIISNKIKEDLLNKYKMNIEDEKKYVTTSWSIL